MMSQRWQQASLEELQKEARSFGLVNLPDDKQKCLQLLVNHLEVNGPLKDVVLSSQNQKISENSLYSDAISITTASANTVGTKSSCTENNDNATTNNSVELLCTLMMEQLNLQRVQLAEQRKDMSLLLKTLTENQKSANQTRMVEVSSIPSAQVTYSLDVSTPAVYPSTARLNHTYTTATQPYMSRGSQPMVSPVLSTPLVSSQVFRGVQHSAPPSTPSFQSVYGQSLGSPLIFPPLYHEENTTNWLRTPDAAIASSGHAVKFLMSLIPTFAGSDDEDVQLWIDKIESVAEIHGLSQVTMLSAATAKLVKTARRWFDLSSGEINRSWFCFRREIMDRFERKVLFHEVMQRIESRRWNFSKESFQDYCMEKLALMKPLKLEEADSIQLLINRINNIAIKGIAASLRINSINQFLREMQHITATCGDPLRRPQHLTNAKFEKSKDTKPEKTKTVNDQNEKSGFQQRGGKDVFCVYCRGKDHFKASCPKLSRKEDDVKSGQPNKAASVAVVEESIEDSNNVVACMCDSGGLLG